MNFQGEIYDLLEKIAYAIRTKHTWVLNEDGEIIGVKIEIVGYND